MYIGKAEVAEVRREKWDDLSRNGFASHTPKGLHTRSPYKERESLH